MCKYFKSRTQYFVQYHKTNIHQVSRLDNPEVFWSLAQSTWLIWWHTTAYEIMYAAISTADTHKKIIVGYMKDIKQALTKDTVIIYLLEMMCWISCTHNDLAVCWPLIWNYLALQTKGTSLSCHPQLFLYHSLISSDATATVNNVQQ